MQNFMEFFVYPPHLIATKTAFFGGISRKFLSVPLVPFITKQHGETRKGAIFFKFHSPRTKQKSRYTTAQITDFSVCTCYVTAFARELPHAKYVIFGCIRIRLTGNTHNGVVCLTYLLGVLVYHKDAELSR